LTHGDDKFRSDGTEVRRKKTIAGILTARLSINGVRDTRVKKPILVAAAAAALVAVAMVLLLRAPGGDRGRGAMFSRFPLDVPQAVQVDWQESTLAKTSGRARRDQVRDWLLLSVLSNAGLTVAQLNQILATTPPARFDYLRPIGTFEYGDTRAGPIGRGRVIALVPADQRAEAR